MPNVDTLYDIVPIIVVPIIIFVSIQEPLYIVRILTAVFVNISIALLIVYNITGELF